MKTKNKVLTLTLMSSSFLLANNTSAQSFSELFNLSKFNGTKSVSNTIVISKSGTYDFKNVLHIWKGKNWNCNAEKEHGPQILRIEASNVTVKNFAYIGDGKTHGSNGLGDPIHVTSCARGQGNLCSGNGPSNVVIDHIYGHACEDMITIGTPKGRNVTIQNSTLIATPSKSSWDKTIQINFGTDMRIIGNSFIGCERAIRLKPKTSGIIENNSFKNCKTAVQMSTKDADISPMANGPTYATLRNNKYNGAKVICKDGGSVSSSGSVVCK